MRVLAGQGMAMLTAAFSALRHSAAGGWEWTSLPPALLALLIFSLRAADLALSTVRMLAVARGRSLLAWVTGFAESLIFVTAIAGVLDSLDNAWNLIAYAGGFATGNVIGMVIEERLAPGHSLLRIVSSTRGSAVAESLRERGYGATELAGRGQEGTVGMVLCFVPRRQVGPVRQQVLTTDPRAFVTVEEVRSLYGGWRA